MVAQRCVAVAALADEVVGHDTIGALGVERPGTLAARDLGRDDALARRRREIDHEPQPRHLREASRAGLR
jgi:hypothetical protein